ncbi:MAG: hypothetical protein CSA62_05645 [Planctomycetota bacterium]|nr:MAG: hypothetical protein CSA62_05645 [Planctomycetota bacterium]
MTQSPSQARSKDLRLLPVARPGAMGFSLLFHSLVVALGVVFGEALPSRPQSLPIRAADWQSPEERPEIEVEKESPQEIQVPELSEPKLLDPEMKVLAEERPFFELETLDLEPQEPKPRPLQHWLARVLPEKKPVEEQRPEPVEQPSPKQPPPARAEPEPIAGQNPSPRYPKRAIKLQLEGLAEIRVVVAKEGHVLKAEIIRSTGAQILDQEALRAVRTWRFAGGPGTTVVEIEFRLLGRRP